MQLVLGARRISTEQLPLTKRQLLQLDLDSRRGYCHQGSGHNVVIVTF